MQQYKLVHVTKITIEFLALVSWQSYISGYNHTIISVFNG